MDKLPRLGKRRLMCLLLFTCNYVVSVRRGFLFLWVLGMGYVILLWHSQSLHIIIFIAMFPPFEDKLLLSIGENVKTCLNSNASIFLRYDTFQSRPKMWKHTAMFPHLKIWSFSA